MKIKIRTVGINQNDSNDPCAKEVYKAYTDFDETLKKNGTVKASEKIDHYPIGGVISSAKVNATYFFQECLVENEIIPKVFDGVFHKVTFAGELEKVDKICTYLYDNGNYCETRLGARIFESGLDIRVYDSISELEETLKSQFMQEHFSENSHSLFDQLKSLESSKKLIYNVGAIISQICKQINTMGISERGIKRVLEYVPKIFSIDWDGSNHDTIIDAQRKACKEISQIEGAFSVSGRNYLGNIIKLGIEQLYNFHTLEKYIKIGSLS